MSVEEHRKLDERLREKRNQRPLPIRSDIPVKRMRIRRDRAKLYYLYPLVFFQMCN